MSGYRMVPLTQGYPGKSTYHGGLSWSSITLLTNETRMILVDSGSFAMRPMLGTRLAEHGIDPGDVTDILLTHAHHDHAANYLLFPAATVWISGAELEWASRLGPAFIPLPELYAEDLAGNPRTCRIEEDGEFLPGLESFATPGHTPGSRVFRVRGTEGSLLFTGDAAKNRAELVSGEVDMSLDRPASHASVRRIRELWQEIDGTLLVPGHDVPMRWIDGQPRYEGTRLAAIDAWFADDLTTTTNYDLTEPKGR